MEKLQYHIRRGSMVVIAICGLCAIWGVGFLVAWGVSDIIARFM